MQLKLTFSVTYRIYADNFMFSGIILLIFYTFFFQILLCKDNMNNKMEYIL